MTGRREADASLDRATDEALALFADTRAAAAEPDPDPEPQRESRGPGGPLPFDFPFDEDPFEDAPAAPGREEPPLDVPFAGVRYYDATGGTAERTGDGTEPSPGHGTPWQAARRTAALATAPLQPCPRPLGDALGHTLAAPLTALTDLPSFDTSAMDGWAVAGPGPWRLPADGDGILAGHAGTDVLRDGHAVPIATGARVPAGATAVLRSEYGIVRDAGELLHATRHITQGADIRPRGQECRTGDALVPAGTLVGPAVLGLAAATGYDELTVAPRPRVEVLVLGDELLREGLPDEGRIRDALGPMLGPWLRALGAEVTATRFLGDDAAALRAALNASDADLVLTTGGTAAGPVDHVHPTLCELGAEWLVDGVAVRPGHPMLLARYGPGKHVVGLPGNPLAAVAGLLTLAEPLLGTLAGRGARRPRRAVLTEAVAGRPSDTRLVPVADRGEGRARPLRFHGPAMLRGLAAADALAVVPPGGAPRGATVELLGLPWADGASGGAP
ncbi:molybdopterin molybdotransferase MoeA [Streptomyces morookaense]|uniref:Molybdopterin molybdenumtransferase n=1 Tax=Streptomyces morookaense TaxID=1970 RepID=A0A7Y7B0N1_STRMO|nr:molybdopterin molybdotransferase MoeA [Streptomyces morookaense]NVK76834.1 molybdopterin molybdenumtransferase MoeA [Streptomyces morookaense]GHF26174.1 molybdopterin molybdenumtransferase MoeA [Streptomyces morookaense]